MMRAAVLLALVLISCGTRPGGAEDGPGPAILALELPNEASAGTAVAARVVFPVDVDLARTVVWTSAVDGLVGVGESSSLSFRSVGSHLVTATVLTSRGSVSSSAAIDITSEAKGVAVLIVSPASGARLRKGELVAGQCELRDAAGALVPTTSVTWSSDLDGDLPSTGARFSLRTAGTHALRCSAADSSGATYVGRATVEVTSEEQTTVFISAPTVSQLAVRAGAGELFGPTLRLTATVQPSPERAKDIIWTEHDGQGAVVGELGRGAAISATLSGLGKRSVRASLGQAGPHDVVTVEVVGDLPPRCTIVSPDSRSAIAAAGELTRFTARCEDPDSPTSIAPVWIAEDGNAMGTGEALALVLPPGRLQLRACPTANASDGCDVRNLDVIVNSKPTTCAVQLGVPLATAAMGSSGALEVHGFDIDEARSSIRFRVSSDVDGELCVSAHCSLRRVQSAGRHNVTLTVDDSFGARCAATTTFDVQAGPTVSAGALKQSATSCPSAGCAAGVATFTDVQAHDPDGVTGLEWVDGSDGTSGSGPALLLPAPSAGRHGLLLRATDRWGAVGTRYVQTTFLPAGQNELVARAPSKVTPASVAALPGGDLAYVDGSDRLYRYRANGAVQPIAQLQAAGSAVASTPLGQVIAGTSLGVEVCSANACSAYATSSAVRALAVDAAADLLFIGLNSGVLITRISAPDLGVGDARSRGKLLLAGTTLRALAVHRAGNVITLFVGTDEGVAELAVEPGADLRGLHVAARWHRPPRVPAGQILALTVTGAGRAYVMTETAVAELGAESIPFFRAPFSFPAATFRSMAVERQTRNGVDADVLWLGTSDGLLRYDVSTAVPSRIHRDEGLTNPVLSLAAVATDGAKHLFTSTDTFILSTR